jgi:hypothetical protein
VLCAAAVGTGVGIFVLVSLSRLAEQPIPLPTGEIMLNLLFTTAVTAFVAVGALLWLSGVRDVDLLRTE